LKTLTIKQADIDSLDSDESKLEFVNSVIALLSGSEKTLNAKLDDELSLGLNPDLPEPMEDAPDFDSNNMCAPEFRRYSFLKAGYVPKSLYCSYSKYAYCHLSDLTYDKIFDLMSSASLKIGQSKGKRDYLKFLTYLCEIYKWYLYEVLWSSMRREVIDA